MTTWREISDDEREALRPFTLQCEGLDDEAVERVRAQFRRSLRDFGKNLAAELGRVPSEHELKMLAAAIVKWINCEFVPELRQRQTGLN